MGYSISDERHIIEGMFMIADKAGRDVPFVLNSAQADLLPRLIGRGHVVPKARQEGVSSLILALFTVRCLYRNNTRAVVISHDKESTERLFKRVKYFLDNLRGPAAVLETSSKREFSFPKTNSVFYIGTAGARKFGRGDTITDLHCSEVAFWDNPLDLTAGLFQAVPRSGFICLESTGNGRNWFYRRVMRGRTDASKWKVHFLDWVSFDEYDLELEPDEEAHVYNTLDQDLEEVELFNEHGLTLGQIQFRREKLDEFDFDIDTFKQEYPRTLEECFKATGRSIFHKVNYIEVRGWQRDTTNLHKLDMHPKKRGTYAIGADVSGGIGQDRSIAQIIGLENREQVGEWASDRIAPDVFAQKLAELGERFNFAYITVEANNHGIVTLNELRKIYPVHLIHRKQKVRETEDHILDYGLLTTSKTRPLAIGSLRKDLAQSWVVHSPQLKDELDTFIENENGKMEAEEGCWDDRVIAMAMASYTYERACMKLGSVEEEIPYDNDPFLIDNIIDELTKGHNRGYPIAPQTRRYDEDSFSIH